MAVKSRPPDAQEPLELAPDFPYESRHEFVEELAYKLWGRRGSPIGSPDVDWFAAEKAVYATLVASGMITPSPNDPTTSEMRFTAGGETAWECAAYSAGRSGDGERATDASLVRTRNVKLSCR
jgi:hypothetical protein